MASNETRPLVTLAESFLLMGTMVRIRVVGDDRVDEMRAIIDEAMAAMRAVEEVASRFDEQSALRELCRNPGVFMSVPPILFHALAIARAAAEMTDGIFDPTIGSRLEQAGFNRHYLSGERTTSGISLNPAVNWRDLTLVEEGCQVRLEQPMLLDLGAVAKGLAVDLAAKVLERVPGSMIDAGGDVWATGVDPDGGVWPVGIEDPHDPARLLGVLNVSGLAVCTSGRYRRQSPHDGSLHHLINPKTGDAVKGLISVTVVGKEAVLADVAATAAFLLGPQRALPFIQELGLEGLMVSDDGTLTQTPGMEGYWRG